MDVFSRDVDLDRGVFANIPQDLGEEIPILLGLGLGELEGGRERVKSGGKLDAFSQQDEDPVFLPVDAGDILEQFDEYRIFQFGFQCSEEVDCRKIRASDVIESAQGVACAVDSLPLPVAFQRPGTRPAKEGKVDLIGQQPKQTLYTILLVALDDDYAVSGTNQDLEFFEEVRL